MFILGWINKLATEKVPAISIYLSASLVFCGVLYVQSVDFRKYLYDVFFSKELLVVFTVFILVLILAPTIVSRVARRVYALFSPDSALEWESFAADSSIEFSHEDAFHRGNYADQVANLICVPPSKKSVVVGVESEWGSGKTSFLNMVMKSASLQRRGVLVLKFNPWYYQNERDIAVALTSLVSAAIEKSGVDISHHDFLGGKGIRSMLSAFLDPGSRANLLHDFLFGDKIIDQEAHVIRERINREIQIFGRPVLIVIDDLDRLLPNEIRSVFRLLKSVCDFDGISYLLAYERNPIVSALSFNEGQDGSRYLEKFIQATINLPKISFEMMSKHLRESVSSKFPGIEKDERFEKASRLLTYMVDTPRNVQRLSNSLLMEKVRVSSGVDAVDLVLFLAVRTVFPGAFDYIRSNAEDFAPRVFEYDRPSIDEYVRRAMQPVMKEEDRNSRLDALVDELCFAAGPRLSRDFARELIEFLFPISYDFRVSRYDLLHGRICHYNGLMLLLATDPGLFLPEDAHAFFNDPVARVYLWERYVREGELSEWYEFLLLGVKSNVARPESRGKINIFIDDCFRLYLSVFVHGKVKIDPPASILFHIVHGDHRCLDFLRDISKRLDSVHFSELVLVSWLVNGKAFQGGRWLNDSEASVSRRVIEEICSEWCFAVDSLVESFELHKQPGLISVIFRRAQLDKPFAQPDFSVSSEIVAKYLKNDDKSYEFIKAILVEMKGLELGSIVDSFLSAYGERFLALAEEMSSEGNLSNDESEQLSRVKEAFRKPKG